MNNFFLSLVASLTFIAFSPQLSYSNDGAVESTKETGRDAKRSVKKGYRAAKDEVCEMVNGKMECVAKKVGNKMKNAGDKIEDATE